MARRSTQGPLVRTPARPLAVKRAGCFLVLMRNLKPGNQQGQWQPLSTSGFRVVCASRLEASECVWMTGGALYPRPAHLAVDRGDADFTYLNWLLEHHFRIVPYTAGDYPMEVSFADFVKGWYPNAEDIPGAIKPIPSETRQLVDAALRFKWEGR
jgi:hypothetical protein